MKWTQARRGEPHPLTKSALFNVPAVEGGAILGLAELVETGEAAERIKLIAVQAVQCPPIRPGAHDETRGASGTRHLRLDEPRRVVHRALDLAPVDIADAPHVFVRAFKLERRRVVVDAQVVEGVAEVVALDALGQRKTASRSRLDDRGKVGA